MGNRISALLAAASAFLASLSLTGVVFGHHANSAYDRTQEISVTGTVTQWQFINPHAGLWLEVIDKQGNVTKWAAEMQSIQDLYRGFGWNKNTFQPGDTVTIIGAPDRRPNRHSMWTSRVVFADGKTVDLRARSDDPRAAEQTP